jgi:uncharacterized membrane protein YqgA involved in biofilm formation
MLLKIYHDTFRSGLIHENMENLILSLKFFSGLILFLAVGWFIGHLLKLDKKYEKMQKELNNKRNKK